MKVKFQSCNEFVLGEYYSRKDVKRASAFTEEQIMQALGKSKEYNVRDWYGSVDEVTFTISSITKDKYGDYIYTVESSQRVPERFFPTPYDICIDYGDLVCAISYAMLY